MITSAFIILASLVLSLVLLLMYPFRYSNGFPDSVDTAVSWFATYTSKIDTFIPLEAIHTFVMFVIAFEIAVLTFYVIRWVFGFMPFVGGR